MNPTTSPAVVLRSVTSARSGGGSGGASPGSSANQTIRATEIRISAMASFFMTVLVSSIPAIVGWASRQGERLCDNVGLAKMANVAEEGAWQDIPSTSW